MRPISQRLSAPGITPWIPLDYIECPFLVGLFVNPSSGSTLLADVQLSADNPWLDSTTLNNSPTSPPASQGNKRFVTITRAATTATVTDPLHGLSTGDSIIVEGAGAPFDTAVNASQQATITFVDQNTYTYTVANSGATVSAAGARLGSLRVFNHATLAAVAARANGSIAFPVRACRLNAGTVTGGTVDLVVLQGSTAP